MCPVCGSDWLFKNQDLIRHPLFFLLTKGLYAPR